jgi:hypothetical protein
VRALGPARGGHLGNPRRPQGLHLRPVPVLGGAEPRDPAGGAPGPAGERRPLDSRTRQALPPDHEPRVEPAEGHLHPALRLRGPGRFPAAHAADGLRQPDRPDVAVHAGRDGPRAGLRRPGLPVQPQRLTGRAARPRGHFLAVHLLLRRRPRPVRPAHRRRTDLPENAHLRQPPRPVLRGGRAHRRAARQLPPGSTGRLQAETGL